MDDRILPSELKQRKLSKWELLKLKAVALKDRLRNKKYIVKGIRPAGAPTYNPHERGMVASDGPHPDYYAAMVRERGEVIKPLPDDTPEAIAELMSQAACDHEFRRVIVYPVQGEVRRQVLELVKNRPERYPMYEYAEANITNNDDLNSQTIIYKYAGQSHFTKPV
jgi:hypothetical protein